MTRIILRPPLPLFPALEARRLPAVTLQRTRSDQAGNKAQLLQSSKGLVTAGPGRLGATPPPSLAAGCNGPGPRGGDREIRQTETGLGAECHTRPWGPKARPPFPSCHQGHQSPERTPGAWCSAAPGRRFWNEHLNPLGQSKQARNLGAGGQAPPTAEPRSCWETRSLNTVGATVSWALCGFVRRPPGGCPATHPH